MRDACVASFGYATHTDLTAPPQIEPSPSLPLFHEVMQSHDKKDVEAESCCVLVARAGRVHGICYRDKASVRRFASESAVKECKGRSCCIPPP